MADRAESSGRAPGTGTGPADRRETVLIIEDDPGVARLEELHLRRAGFLAECVHSAEAGLVAIARGGIDLIVLDQKLQGPLSGLDLFEQLRALGDLTPAILVTGLSDEATLIRALRGGLSDFVPKTADYLDDLTRAANRVISQVRTRRRLAESEERLAGVTLLAQAIPQIVWTARPDGYLDFTNHRWYDYSGLTQEETEGWNWCRSLHPDDLDRVSREWGNSLASGKIFESEYRLRRGSDGAFRWFLARGELVRDPSGPMVKWFGTCTDIDDQKRHEQTLKKATAFAENASRAKDQFLAMLSHELRTPLTPVLLLAAAARDDEETPTHLRQTFEEIRQNLELEVRLIDDLLDVMRIIRGKMPYQFEVVEAGSLIRRAIEICRVDALEKNLSFDVELSTSLHRVKADPSRLQQVLWNLIKNAVKFTPIGGRVAIRARDEGSELVVEVKDTGIGIEAPLLPLIFNAFEQGEDAITRRFGGLGLGLAISRSIAEGHGGHLSASSEGKGLGATFTLRLPSVDPSEGLNPGAGQDQSAESTILDAPSPADLRILFVEDDAMTARIMAKLLRQNGYSVSTASSMAGALAIPSEDYDLVVSDIGLPEGSGLDLMREIRLRHDVPGIALTGFGMEDDIRRSRESGFVAHLTKPLDFAKLDAMIRQVAAEHGVSPRA